MTASYTEHYRNIGVSIPSLNSSVREMNLQRLKVANMTASYTEHPGLSTTET